VFKGVDPQRAALEMNEDIRVKENEADEPSQPPM
jgi:hypothetical protein